MNEEQVSAITANTPVAEVEKRALEAQLAKEQHKEDLKWLLTSPAGRRLVIGLIQSSRLFAHAFHELTNQQYYIDGRRSLMADFLLDIKQTTPDLYGKLFSDVQNA